MEKEEKKKHKFLSLFTKDEFNIAYSDFYDAIKRKINIMGGLFIACGILAAILSLIMGSLSMIPFGIFISLYGVYNVLNMYILSATGKILSIEGVVIDFGVTGYRRQGRCVIVQTINGESYKVAVSKQKFNDYQEGDIVVFYTTEADIGEKKDGVYTPEKVFDIERVELEDDKENNPKVKKAFEFLLKKADD